MGCLYQTPSLRGQGTMQKRRPKDWGSQHGGRHQGDCPSDTTGLTHAWTHRNWLPAQIQDSWVPSAERGDDQKPQSLTKGLSPINNCKGKLSLLQHSFAGYINCTWKKTPMPEIDDQHKMNSKIFLKNFFVLCCLIWIFFFTSLVFCIYLIVVFF